MRVLFTTAPLHGHLTPLVPLAWACRASGHEVLLATSAHFVDAALRTGLPATATGPGLDVRELGDPAASHGIADARHEHGVVFGRMAARNLAGALALVDAWRPDLVFAERAEFAGPIAAAARGVPHADLRWGVAELREYEEGATTVLDAERARLGLADVPAPKASFNPWPPSLRLPHADGHRSIRHVPYDGLAHLPEWVLAPAGRGRICLTLGTVLPHLATTGLTRMLTGIIEGLATLGREIVVAMDEEHAGRLGALPTAVRHLGRVPLSALLPTCELFIHHGGQGSALTALAAGCPQVALPMFDDQFENADAVARAGVGYAVPLHRTDPDEVTGLCRRALADPRLARCGSLVSDEISRQPSPVEVVGELEALVGRGPSGR
ncbi:nucleotide disphospho-sugar-binding domain-containing protein [Micromonospora chersina]|uniref:nucleotide disphospho-sugar-binding domain-containing protein n=1 Tax=Micromonospora chersina TaxID=47854 RepID=UPI00340107F0